MDSLRQSFNPKNRALIVELVRSEFKLRYQGSVLGYAWSLLKPLLLFVILYIVFVRFLKIGADIEHYPIYLLLGIVLWNFFSETTSQGLGSIVGRGDMIKKIKIPKWIIVLSSSISALINLGLNLIVIIVFMIVDGVELLNTVILFPLIILEIYLLALGIALILGTAFVKYRDVSYIWEVIMQAGFYATPIIYPLAYITNVAYQKLILLNPMAQAIQDARYVLVTHQTPNMSSLFTNDAIRLLPVGFCIAVLVIGILYFRNNSKNFAENL